ncbi:MAG: hypothetical protein P4L40_08670 [Terracidiphilus sp.]|nr:hypothetical protein [Terracidiphilus sp.]
MQRTLSVRAPLLTVPPLFLCDAVVLDVAVFSPFRFEPVYAEDAPDAPTVGEWAAMVAVGAGTAARTAIRLAAAAVVWLVGFPLFLS